MTVFMGVFGRGAFMGATFPGGSRNLFRNSKLTRYSIASLSTNIFFSFQRLTTPRLPATAKSPSGREVVPGDSVRRARVLLSGREVASPTMVEDGVSVPGPSAAVLRRAPPPPLRFMASRMAVMSASTAPSVQAAYTDSIVVGR